MRLRVLRMRRARLRKRSQPVACKLPGPSLRQWLRLLKQRRCTACRAPRRRLRLLQRRRQQPCSRT